MLTEILQAIPYMLENQPIYATIIIITLLFSIAVIFRGWPDVGDMIGNIIRAASGEEDVYDDEEDGEEDDSTDSYTVNINRIRLRIDGKVIETDANIEFTIKKE